MARIFVAEDEPIIKVRNKGHEQTKIKRIYDLSLMVLAQAHSIMGLC
jgi:hypothetical protein